MAAGNFFGGEFFGGGFFGAITPTDDAPPAGGKGDNPKGKRYTVKPLGLPFNRPVSAKAKEAIVDGRLAEQADIAGQIAREFSEETAALIPQPIAQMSPEEVAYEIGIRLRQKMRQEEDELLIMLTLVAAAV